MSGSSPSADTFSDPYSYKLKTSEGDVAVMVFNNPDSGYKSLRSSSSLYLSSPCVITDIFWSCCEKSPTSMVCFDLICSSFYTMVLYSSSMSLIFWSISCRGIWLMLGVWAMLDPSLALGVMVMLFCLLWPPPAAAKVWLFRFEERRFESVYLKEESRENLCSMLCLLGIYSGEISSLPGALNVEVMFTASTCSGL